MAKTSPLQGQTRLRTSRNDIYMARANSEFARLLDEKLALCQSGQVRDSTNPSLTQATRTPLESGSDLVSKLALELQQPLTSQTIGSKGYGRKTARPDQKKKPEQPPARQRPPCATHDLTTLTESLQTRIQALFQIGGENTPKRISKDDIKRIYWRLAAHHHPDRCSGDPAIFLKAKGLYEALTRNWPKSQEP